MHITIGSKVNLVSVSENDSENVVHCALKVGEMPLFSHLSVNK